MSSVSQITEFDSLPSDEVLEAEANKLVRFVSVIKAALG
jgi:hypothetical protein